MTPGTFFYEAPEVANWEDSWIMLRHLGSQLSLPWVCIGDFNEITRVQERSGGCIWPESQMQVFRDCLDVYGLKDLGFTGLPFTWCNRPNKPFKFESMWLIDEQCKEVVHSAWDIGPMGNQMENVLLKVSNCQSLLSTWNKEVFRNVCILLAQKRKQLVKAEASSMVGSNHDRVKSLSEEIKNLMKLEECMWSQRAKSDWLKYGDQNTKYFDCRSLKRNKRNFIVGLKNEVRDWIENEGKIGDMIVNYYLVLFTSSNPLSLDSVLCGVEPRVSPSMNVDLDRPFEASEV
ncbi:uncharacterized protein LOC142616189 [Castanea sativa]|uniref:uncharacterized protein LOC142616189 n=1 Tax=Castanea sativa TaxID=21020 RepID=UPI003F652753